MMAAAERSAAHDQMLMRATEFLLHSHGGFPHCIEYKIQNKAMQKGERRGTESEGQGYVLNKSKSG
jgi:hypothetical protein